MNTATQLKALIRNLSKDKGVNSQILLRNYMLERLLERISVSKYRHEFILKGGMLIAAMVGIDTRSTMDMDATIKGQTVNKDNIEAILNEIVSIDIGDNIAMRLKSIEEIRDEAEYPGLRASIEVSFDGIENTLKLDMTTGDKIVPKEICYRFKLMFEERYLDVMAYNIETVLAEKIETILTRATANTRMRDFYDVYIMLTIYQELVDFELFQKALYEVAEKRGSLEMLFDKENIIADIKISQKLRKLWGAYQIKYQYAKEVEWTNIIKALEQVLF